MPDNTASPFIDPREQPPVQPGSRTGSCGRTSRASWAIFLILFGIALFLSNIGLFPIHNIWTYWPLYLVFLGVSKLIAGRPQERAGAVILTGIGTIFFASNQGWLHIRSHDWTSIVGLMLVVFGVLSLTAVGGRSSAFAARRARRRHWNMSPYADSSLYTQPPPTPDPDDQWLRDAAVFGGIKRRIDTNQFGGGSIEAIFGSIDLDMRAVALPPIQPAAILHVNCVFGAIKLRIPPHWRVSLQVASAFGATEDKTVPMPRTDLPPSTLVVTGSSTFGAVEIEN